MPDKYELLPPLSIDEYEALRADIELNGVRDPIIVDENGDILDGHNRARIDPNAPRIVLTGKTEAEKKAFVYAANFARRNLSSEQKKELHKMMRSVALELKKEGKTQEQIAAMLGVDRTTVSLWLKDESISIVNVHNANTFDCRIKIPKKEHPIIHERVKAGETQEQIAADYKVNQSRIAQIIKQEAKKEEKKQELEKLIEIAASLPAQDRWSVFEGDIHNVKLEKNSIDAIITDPPYPKDYLPLWEELGKFAQYHLKVGGVLLAMTGSVYLPQVFEMLGKYLTYQWVLACILNGQHLDVYAAKVNNNMWKPILVYRNGGEPVNIGSDLFTNDKRDKNYHEWGQGVEGYLWQIEHFTKPNDLICDPFLGGGTTGVAAVKLQRRFVGFDIDVESVKISRSRLYDATQTR